MTVFPRWVGGAKEGKEITIKDILFIILLPLHQHNDDFLKGETGAVDQKAKSARGNRPHGGTRSLSSHLSSLCSYIIRRRVYGNMAGLEDDDSLDSDSDMLLDGECLNDDDDDNTLLGGNYY